MRGQHSGVHSANRYVSAAVPGGKPICEKIRFRNWARFCEPVGADSIYDIDNFNWTRRLARPRVMLGRNAPHQPARMCGFAREKKIERTSSSKT